MKNVKIFFPAICFMLMSYTAFAASYCLNCFDKIDENEKYCVACKAKFSIDELKTEEEHLIHAVTVSRENYRKALNELNRYYQSTGNQLRLQKSRRELDGLDKVPQPLYTDEGLGNVQTSPSLHDIEDANILFKDALMYKKSLFNKQNQITAINRLEKLLSEYPDSDKVGDSAFEIAEIYASGYFHDYESAAKYYIRGYQLNPYMKQPALLRAAEMYEKLTDYSRAKAIYQQAALYGSDAKFREKAKRKLSVLEQKIAAASK
jgi:TolA-binding protein